MTVLLVIELTCDRCERTGEHRMDHVNVCTAEQFVQRRLAGWNVNPQGRALCPECVIASGGRPRALRIDIPN